MTNKQRNELSLEEIIKLARKIGYWVKYNHISGYGGHSDASIRIRVDKKGILGFLSERFISFEVEAEFEDVKLGRYYINRKNHYNYYFEIKEIYNKAKEKDKEGENVLKNVKNAIDEMIGEE